MQFFFIIILHFLFFLNYLSLWSKNAPYRQSSFHLLSLLLLVVSFSQTSHKFLKLNCLSARYQILLCDCTFLRQNCGWVFIFEQSCVISSPFSSSFTFGPLEGKLFFPCREATKSSYHFINSYCRKDFWAFNTTSLEVPNLLTSFKSRFFRRYFLLNVINIDCAFVPKNLNHRKSGKNFKNWNWVKLSN